VLGDTENHNNVSREWNNEWALESWVDPLISHWLRERFLPLLVKEPAEFPESDEDDPLREAIILKQKVYENALRSAPPSQKAVLFCPLPGEFRHLNWWLPKYCADHVDTFHVYAEMGNEERTEMQLKFQDSGNPCVFVTTPKVEWTGLNLAAAIHMVITDRSRY
jgi:hypothetical protein